MFGNLLVRAAIDDRQQQARAALWLELIEKGPQCHTVRNARSRVRYGPISLANSVERFTL